MRKEPALSNNSTVKAQRQSLRNIHYALLTRNLFGVNPETALNLRM